MNPRGKEDEVDPWGPTLPLRSAAGGSHCSEQLATLQWWQRPERVSSWIWRSIRPSKRYRRVRVWWSGTMSVSPLDAHDALVRISRIPLWNVAVWVAASSGTAIVPIL